MSLLYSCAERAEPQMPSVRRVRSSSHLPAFPNSFRKGPARAASNSYIRSSHTRNDSVGSIESMLKAPQSDAAPRLTRKLSSIVLRHARQGQSETQKAQEQALEPVHGFMPAIILGPYGAFHGMVYVPRVEGPGKRILVHAGNSLPPDMPVTLLTQPLPVPQQAPQAPAYDSLSTPGMPMTPHHDMHEKSTSMEFRDKPAYMEPLTRQQEVDEEFQGILRDWQQAFGKYTPGGLVHTLPTPGPAVASQLPPSDHNCQEGGVGGDSSLEEHSQPERTPVGSVPEGVIKSPHNLSAAIRNLFREGREDQNCDTEQQRESCDATTTTSTQSGGDSAPDNVSASASFISPDPSVSDSPPSHQRQRNAKRSIRNLGRRLVSTWGPQDRAEI